VISARCLNESNVTPAEAGVQKPLKNLNSGLRRNEGRRNRPALG
jgi:hypothetical protein